MNSLESLLAQVRNCQLCAAYLPLGARPVLQLASSATILIAGQAPGRKVHESGIPFNDASGERLRDWLGLSSEQFYDASKIAIVPMGFCYPGTGNSGDLPPRPECAATWRAQLLSQLPNLQLSLLVGQYSQHYHLPRRHANLTQTVQAWRDYLPAYLPLPHPSPRNNIWLKRNPWFTAELLPELRQREGAILSV